MRHAPYAIAGIVLVYGKTTKTACGKRIATEKLVRRDQTDCPACRYVVAYDAAVSSHMMQVVKEMQIVDLDG